MTSVNPRRTPRPVSRALRAVADDVSAWRRIRDLTQAQLADRADISVKTLSRLEGGDGGVSLENTLRVLRALGVVDPVMRALDPLSSDIGRLRSVEALPRRVHGRDPGERRA